jgi:hypothetical protein
MHDQSNLRVLRFETALYRPLCAACQEPRDLFLRHGAPLSTSLSPPPGEPCFLTGRAERTWRRQRGRERSAVAEKQVARSAASPQTKQRALCPVIGLFQSGGRGDLIDRACAHSPLAGPAAGNRRGTIRGLSEWAQALKRSSGRAARPLSLSSPLGYLRVLRFETALYRPLCAACQEAGFSRWRRQRGRAAAGNRRGTIRGLSEWAQALKRSSGRAARPLSLSGLCAHARSIKSPRPPL